MSSVFVYDLIDALRRDPDMEGQVRKNLKRIDRISADILDGKATRQSLMRAQADLIPACGFNFGMLIPSFFIRYPFDKPLSFLDRPFMFAMTCMAPNSVVTLKAGRQVGKCADGETRVKTNRGQMTLSELFESGIPES